MMKINCGCDSLPSMWWSNSNCGWRVPSLRSTVPYFLLLVHVLWQVMMYYLFICLCFNTVGWASERASGLQKNWVMRCWRGYLSEARCKWSAYGPADATATPSSLASLKSRMVLPFWCQLTQVVLKMRLLNGCLSVFTSFIIICRQLFFYIICEKNT